MSNRQDMKHQDGTDCPIHPDYWLWRNTVERQDDELTTLREQMEKQEEYYLSQLSGVQERISAELTTFRAENERLKKRAWAVVGDSQEWECDCPVCVELRAALAELERE